MKESFSEYHSSEKYQRHLIMRPLNVLRINAENNSSDHSIIKKQFLKFERTRAWGADRESRYAVQNANMYQKFKSLEI